MRMENQEPGGFDQEQTLVQGNEAAELACIEYSHAVQNISAPDCSCCIAPADLLDPVGLLD